MSREREREEKKEQNKPKTKKSDPFHLEKNLNGSLLSRSGRGRANLQGVAVDIRQAAGNSALSPVVGVVGLTNLSVVGSKQLLL